MSKMITTKRHSRVSALRLLAFVAFFGLCHTGASAQQRPIAVKVIKSEKIAATDSQMELLFWVMGSRHGRPSMDAVQTISQKKQLINSGMAPNRILSRTFLNKAINYDTTIT